MPAPFSIPGSDNQPIIGDSHMPAGDPCGVVLVAHGFKGYKDYGMFPRIATTLADAGFIAHRFNFSHSGMTNTVETFERPDLFERDSWNRQVADLRALLRAIGTGELAGHGLRKFLFGHSRGGVTVLLAAGRAARDGEDIGIAGIVTAAAPATCNSLIGPHQELLLEQGYLESPSSRTGQTLRVGADALREQLSDPDGHDLLPLVAAIDCPILVIHGAADPTVPVESAHAIGGAASRAEVHVIAGADHVFNTPNPLQPDAAVSPQLEEMLRAMVGGMTD